SIIPLKLAAIRAGIGWQGKHSLLISRKYGTFLALGGIITNANLDHNDKEEINRCRNCKKCQEACPLKALENDYILNKDRCLSYILQNDNIPEEAKIVSENRIMDCEICQQVCPWNAKHIKQPLNTRMTLTFQKKIAVWEDFFILTKLVKLTEHDYKKTLSHLNSGIPYSIFYRNILMAMEHIQNY
ncbi:MAG: 4Fe-4S double cluster binding domain-containing protein, partial [Atribacterota bacterium]